MMNIEGVDEATLARLKTLREKHIYFARAETLGLIKIGITGDVAYRLRHISFVCPDRILALGVISGSNEEREEAIHIAFGHLRVRGEWFSSAPALLSFIARHDTAGPKRLAEIQRIVDEPDLCKGRRNADGKNKRKTFLQKL